MDAIEESIRETLRAQKEYLSAWDQQWRKRVACEFAPLSGDSNEEQPQSSSVSEVSEAALQV